MENQAPSYLFSPLITRWKGARTLADADDAERRCSDRRRRRSLGASIGQVVLQRPADGLLEGSGERGLERRGGKRYGWLEPVDVAGRDHARDQALHHRAARPSLARSAQGLAERHGLLGFQF